MKKQILFALAVSIGLLLGGCGAGDFGVKAIDQNNTGGNSGSGGNGGGDDNNSTGDSVVPVVVIPSAIKNVTISHNKEMHSFAIKVFKNNAPYTHGHVHVSLPSKVMSGIDVGQFKSYDVNVSQQGSAIFDYTGPDNLAALIAQSDTSSVFKFSHSENSGATKSITVTYQTPANPIPDRNYALEMSTDGNFSMGLEKTKSFAIHLKVSDSSGQPSALSDEKITKVSVRTTNATIAQIKNGAQLSDSITLPNKADNNFALQSKKYSGLVPMEITVEFDDLNLKHRVLTKIVNVRVMSGPPTAISVSYVGTTQDKARAKYIETMAISVTDAYGNKVNTHPNISVGAIAGYTVDGRESSGTESNETRRLYYGKNAITEGEADGMLEQLGGHKGRFLDTKSARSNVFKYVNTEGSNTDKLVVFGEGKNYEAMGKWDFARSDNHTLNLADNYYGVDRTGLSYAVGHNYYQDPCRSDGREWTGNADSDSYQVDDEGTVTIRYAYDYHLMGKDVLLWVNLSGLQPDTGKKTRLGEVTKHTLRGMGLVAAPSGGYSVAKGGAGYAKFTIWHKNASERYRNAHFGHMIAPGSDCNATKVANSNNFDARTCSNGGSTDGTSYVIYYLKAPADKDCTFNITNILPSSEF